MKNRSATVENPGENNQELESPVDNKGSSEPPPFDLDDDVAQYCVPC